MDEELNKDVVIDIYDKMHKIVGSYIKDDRSAEAYEATKLLMSTCITSTCRIERGILEYTLEEAFNDISDYCYGLVERSE